jgi:hypothetical protein
MQVSKGLFDSVTVLLTGSAETAITKSYRWEQGATLVTYISGSILASSAGGNRKSYRWGKVFGHPYIYNSYTAVEDY